MRNRIVEEQELPSFVAVRQVVRQPLILRCPIGEHVARKPRIEQRHKMGITVVEGVE